MSKSQTGNFGEDIAAAHLQQHGYQVIARNFRTRFGEVDLIAANERYLVFVEVKLRKENARVSGLEAVTPAKQAKLRAAAEEYLARGCSACPPPGVPGNACIFGVEIEGRCPKGRGEWILHPRFDVIAIETASGGQVASIRWVENAF